jgi:glycosyltransferase involved in cell wall biosynthesis
MGVARVQMALLQPVGSRGEASCSSPSPITRGGRASLVPPAALAALMAGAGPAAARRARLDRRPGRRRAGLARAPRAHFRPGDRVACLGQPRSRPAPPARAARQPRHPALPAVLRRHPAHRAEHCEPSLTRSFAARFVALCLQLDRVLAISAEAARDFRRWQRRALPGLDIPVGVVPLDAPFPATLPAALPTELAEDEPFVLCVATLESRKNHALLLHAWLTLLRRHGEAVMPRLVLVGRQGFGAEAALRLLTHTPELRRKVLWLRDLGDGALAALYDRCLFAVFNSFHEGWGLPVTEALAHGKLVVAPDHTSLREAGGRAALYVTSQSEPELADTLWDLIRDPARRAALEAALRGRAPLRSWRDVAEDLAAQLRAEHPARAGARLCRWAGASRCRRRRHHPCPPCRR